MLEMHLKDELFRRAFPQVDVPLDSPTTSQVENVVGGSNTEGAGRGVDGLEGVMAGVRMLVRVCGAWMGLGAAAKRRTAPSGRLVLRGTGAVAHVWGIGYGTP